MFTQSGGIEVARTPERMIELRRRCSQAKAWGIPAELVTPGEVNKLVPYLDESVILGGAHFPTVGVVDSLRAGTLMREAAQKSGALTVLAGGQLSPGDGNGAFALRRIVALNSPLLQGATLMPVRGGAGAMVTGELW